MISLIKTLIPKSKSCGYLLGQFWVLHAWDAVLLPEHVLPPLAGAGSVQVRVRLWVPDPHVTEQEVQEPQSAQLPFTTTMVRKISVLFSFFKRSLFVWIESNILCNMFIWSHIRYGNFNTIHFANILHSIVVNTYFTYFFPMYRFRSLWGMVEDGEVFSH